MKKISKTKIATTYATALYEAAAETNATAKVFEEVRALESVISQDDELIRFMVNPMVDEADKRIALQQISTKFKWSADMLRCLDIISENRRFGELLLILKEFSHVYYARNNIAEVEVQSVKSLSAAQDKKLREKMEKLLNKKVVVTYKTTPELIGGLRIKFGSEMIDNSIVSKLNRLENVMKGVL